MQETISIARQNLLFNLHFTRVFRLTDVDFKELKSIHIKKS